MNKFKNLYKYFKCEHKYIWYNEFMIQGGMGKIKEYTCIQCGHKKIIII